MSAKRKPDRWNAAWQQALATTSLGWDLALPIFGGALLGHLLDGRLETGYTFTLSLLALGVFSGFYNVMRSIQRMEAQERQRGDRSCVRSTEGRHSDRPAGLTTSGARHSSGPAGLTTNDEASALTTNE